MRNLMVEQTTKIMSIIIFDIEFIPRKSLSAAAAKILEFTWDRKMALGTDRIDDDQFRRANEVSRNDREFFAEAQIGWIWITKKLIGRYMKCFTDLF